jgi:hypothetical protein
VPGRETVERAPVKASLHLLKPENSSAKKYIKYGRESTGRVCASKPLLLVFLRPIGPG